MSAFSPVPANAHASATSTGVADPKTSNVPSHAKAVRISVKTTAARVTFDGSVPDPALPNGIVIPAGVAPAIYELPNGGVLKHCSDTAGNSELSSLWLTF